MAELDDKVVCTKSKIEDVADAIRYKLGESNKYTLDEMPNKVRAIDGGGGSAVINPLSITANGTYTATGNVDGYSPVTVAVVPDLEDITITQNGTYTSQSHDGFDEVTVNVSTSANLETLNVTQNGTYTPTSPVDGYDEVVVNVPEPTTKVVSEFDFSQAEYDLVRSINPDDASASNKALLNPYLYNATYDGTNGVVAWSNGYGSIQTKYYVEPFKNYDIDVEFGDITSTSTSEKQILGMGMGITIYWDGGNNRVRVGNSSGSLYFNDVNSIDYFQNKTVRIIVEWGHDGVNTPTCYVFIKFDGIAERKFIGNIDPNASNSNYLIVGRTTSDDGLYPVQVKGIKITESKWELEPSSRALSEEPSNEEQLEESNKKSVEEETIEEQTDEVIEQNNESVEKASELDA